MVSGETHRLEKCWPSECFKLHSPWLPGIKIPSVSPLVKRRFSNWYFCMSYSPLIVGLEHLSKVGIFPSEHKGSTGHIRTVPSPKSEYSLSLPIVFKWVACIVASEHSVEMA